MAVPAKTANPKKWQQVLVQIPALFPVVGLVLFWLFLMLFGPMMHVEIFRGDPKDSMNEWAMLLGYLFLLGTIMNAAINPILWMCLSYFHRELFPGWYAGLLFLSSVAALYFLGPQIMWFLD